MIRSEFVGMLGACLLSALAGCAGNGGPEVGPSAAPVDESPVPVYAGTDVAEVRVGDHSLFKIVDLGTDVALLLHGHVEDVAVADPMMKRVVQSKSYAEAYRQVAGDGTVPDAVLLLDQKYSKVVASDAESGEAPPEELGAGAEAAAEAHSHDGEESHSHDGADTSPPSVRPQNHAVPSGDANWDWVGDCTWFLGLSPNSCDKRWSATSALWAYSGTLESKLHWAQLMAASHTFGSDILAQQWNSSTGRWDNLFSAYVQPRHYWTLNYGTSTGAKKWRQFYNTGRGGSLARTHTHVGWDVEVPTGDIGRICFRSYLCRTPQG